MNFMKKIIYSLTLLSVFSCVTSCEVLEEAASMVSATPAKPQLTNGEVISGLREALTVGIKNSVNLTSVTDGFLNNSAIRVPFPEDAMKVREKALEWKMDAQVTKFETTLNRAAEEATKEALNIFMNAITNMSVQDGFAILNGGNGAATRFLKDQTAAQLLAAFKPKVSAAIATVKLTDYWNPIISKYNTAMSLTGGQKVNADLDDFVTQKAISGLFHMVEKEEDKIRLDPAARVSELLSKVFGSVMQ
jgi:hypothetical protein